MPIPVYPVVFTPEALDKGRAVIAFDVSDDRVSIIGIFYGGQDYAAALNPLDD